CTLSSSEKKEQIKKMISNDKTKKAVKIASPKSLYMKLMLVPIKMQSTSLTYLEGKAISKVKSGNTKLFAKLKAGR
ncbi:MAG: glycosyltransferase family 2 protein, partial [Oscillospiraceae bacterium]